MAGGHGGWAEAAGPMMAGSPGPGPASGPPGQDPASVDPAPYMVQAYPIGRRENFNHTVDFEGIVGSFFSALRAQNCTTQGPKVNCVGQIDV